MKTTGFLKYLTAEKLVVYVVLVLLLSGFHPVAGRKHNMKFSAPLNSVFYCHVKSVHDGDTFTCNTGQRIRVWAVDTPEVPPKVEVAQPGGIEARNLLKSKILNQNLKCYYKGDSYDRKVAQCYLNNVDIALDLIQKGYARELKHFSKGYYTQNKKKLTDYDRFLNNLKQNFVQ